MKEKCLYVSCSNAISQRNSVTTAPHNISLLSDPLRVGKVCKVKRKPVRPLLKLRHGVCVRTLGKRLSSLTGTLFCDRTIVSSKASSPECELVFTLSISSEFSFPYGHAVAV
jgi:hypothetical protein